MTTEAMPSPSRAAAPGPTRPPPPPRAPASSHVIAPPSLLSTKVFPDSAEARISFKASLLAHLFHQIRQSQQRSISQLQQLVKAHSAPSKHGSDDALLRPSVDGEEEEDSLDDVLSQLVFLQQYFCCLSAHLRCMQGSAQGKEAQGTRAEERAERDAYFQLIATIVGMVRAAPALPNSSTFLPVPPPGMVTGVHSHGALAPSFSAAERPASSPSTNATPSPRKLSPSTRSPMQTQHTRFRSSPGPSTSPPPPRSALQLLTPSTRSTISAPANTTFFQGRWTSLTSDTSDATVDELDSIEDWADDGGDKAQGMKAPAAVKTIKAVPAQAMELGDVREEELDIERMELLRKAQKAEQERALKDVALVNGRWQGAEDIDELDGIPDFDDVQPSTHSQEPSSSSSTHPAHTPASHSSSASSPRPSLSSADELQSALDAMSEDGELSRMGSRRSSASSSRSSSSRSTLVSSLDHSRQPSTVVNLGRSVILDSDVALVEAVSEEVDVTTLGRAELVSADDLDDLSDFQSTEDDQPLPLLAPSSSHPSLVDRSSAELHEFDVSDEWKADRQQEERDYAGMRRSPFGKRVEVGQVGWDELRSFASWFQEKDGSELDDCCGDSVGLEEAEEQEEEEAHESKLSHSLVPQALAQDDLADWGEDDESTR